MSEELLKELRELEVGTFEIEDLAEVGVYAADVTLSGSEAWSVNCSSSCSTSCTSSTCSTCSTTSSC